MTRGKRKGREGRGRDTPCGLKKKRTRRVREEADKGKEAQGPSQRPREPTVKKYRKSNKEKNRMVQRLLEVYKKLKFSYIGGRGVGRKKKTAKERTSDGGGDISRSSLECQAGEARTIRGREKAWRRKLKRPKEVFTRTVSQCEKQRNEPMPEDGKK